MLQFVWKQNTSRWEKEGGGIIPPIPGIQFCLKGTGSFPKERQRIITLRTLCPPRITHMVHRLRPTLNLLPSPFCNNTGWLSICEWLFPRRLRHYCSPPHRRERLSKRAAELIQAAAVGKLQRGSQCVDVLIQGEESKAAEYNFPRSGEKFHCLEAKKRV